MRFRPVRTFSTALLRLSYTRTGKTPPKKVKAWAWASKKACASHRDRHVRRVCRRTWGACRRSGRASVSPDHGDGLSPVDLRLLSAFGSRMRYARTCPSLPLPSPGGRTAHGHLASGVSFLLDEARVDPAGGVALLFRDLAIFLQPALYCVRVLPRTGYACTDRRLYRRTRPRGSS
jgi:hypothetical protein